MPKSKHTLSADNLRHAEYYGMQEKFDELYAKSRDGYEFTNLMDDILSEENILLAYRNLKTNKGSETPGTDKVTITEIGKLPPNEVVEKVRFILTGSQHGYRPKPVRRKDIPRPDGKLRPLGIPCMWDRLIQQCVKQIMEPICEAKFSNNSYGFRPNRSVENAISSCYKHMQIEHLKYVIEFDIEKFFDNVDHSKLIHQIWAMGIHDKHLIYIIKQMLKAEIRMPDGTSVHPIKGTPQGGIISPILANIVLNELDRWVESQWQDHPLVLKYSHDRTSEGKGFDRGSGYRSARGTKLKTMLIVRYADDFRIFCRNRDEANRILIAVTRWLKERLRLNVSAEKTRVVNLEKEYSEFLGFKMRLRRKRNGWTVESHMSDKAIKNAKTELKEQIKRIIRPANNSEELKEIRLYNSMVMGIQNYYSIATDINLDAQEIAKEVRIVLYNGMNTDKGLRMSKTGRELTETEKYTYGKSKMLRYSTATKEPIYPIAYVQTRHPMAMSNSTCSYTPEGRKNLHKNLRINTKLLVELMKRPTMSKSVEFNDNKLSLFSAQWGKCGVTGREFQTTQDIHCHHKVPKQYGGTDAYANLILVLEPVHKLIHATDEETIVKYMQMLALTPKQIEKVNELRTLAKRKTITMA